MMKKRISLLLAALLAAGVFTACGGSNDDVSSLSQPAAEAPSEQAEAPAAEEPAELDAAYLTGLEKGADYPEGKRVVGVMVNNITGSRPTSGLSEAKIVYEIRVEGGITRFMAVFEDYEKIPKVGSVRSARDQFFQLLVPSFGFYVHDGPNQNQPVLQMIKEQEYDEFDITPAKYGSAFYRDSSRAGMPTEYTEYTDGERITQAIQDSGIDANRTYGSPIFAFTPYNEEPRVLEGGDAEAVAVVHSQSYRNLFEYDAASGRYTMQQLGKSGMEPAVDENNGEQLAFDNVLVLFTVMYNYPNSELVFVGYDSGVGYYFNGGKYEVVRWKKGGPQEPLRIFKNDTTETNCELNPGTTYVGIVDHTYQPDFTAQVEEGTAEATAEAGEYNPEETETAD